MRVLNRWLITAWLVALASLAGAGLATGHDRDTREVKESDIRNRERDAERDRRDAERTARETLERQQKEAADLARQTDSDANSSGSSQSGSTSTSGGSGGTSGTNSSSGSGSGSNSGSDSSGSSSGSSNSGSGSDDDGDDGDDTENPSDANGGDSKQLEVETDRQGRERRSGEFLVRGNRELEAHLRAAGFVPLSSRYLRNLDASIVRVQVRTGSSIEADLTFAARIAGADSAEPNYVFRLSGTSPSALSHSPPLGILAATLGAAPNATTSANTAAIRVGVVDTGVDTRIPALNTRITSTRSFGGPYIARPHGTYIAQILAREGAQVEVADVFQTDTQGVPIATAESIARGIDWLAARGLPVINVSITGPNSAVLSAVVARAIARGSIIVAAAGNDGPAAPAVYPAAFAGVVGVTAVDTGGRIYRRANRGDYVDFAALGVRVPVAGANGTVEYVSGTSYAAPLIAAAFARRYNDARPEGAVVQIERMRNDAVDLGPRGRDPVFGWGRIAAEQTRR
jgi:hypothetical protein